MSANPNRLSLATLGALKSRAERDARLVLKDLLARRKRGEAVSYDVIQAAQMHSLMEFVVQEHVSDPPQATAISEFYLKEFDRALTGLWDVLNAATA